MRSVQPSEVQFSCSKQTYLRGAQYARENRVHALTQTLDAGDSIALTAAVDGASTYEVFATLDLNADTDLWEWNSNCSCPVGFNCKHGVAVTLVFCAASDSAVPESSNPDLERWFARLAREQDPVASDGGETLKYVFRPAADPRYARLSLTRQRNLKRGGQGTASSVDWLQLVSRILTQPDRQLPAYLNAEDLDILRFIASMRRPTLTNELTLGDSVGFAALKQIVATGRAYWKSTTTAPLTWAEQRELEIDWRSTEDDLNVLSWRCTPAADLLFATQPACYLDHNALQVGELRTPLDLHARPARMLRLLLELPPVANRDAATFSRQWVQTFDNIAPPRPVTVRHYRPEDAKPRVTLTRQSGELMLKAELGYGQQFTPLELSKTNRVIEDGERVCHITHNHDLAGEVLDRLEELGFAADDENLWFTATGSFDQQLGAWANLLEELELLTGWQVEATPEFDLSFEEGDWLADLEPTGNDWFSLALSVQIEGHNISLLPVIANLLQQTNDVAALYRRLASSNEQLYVEIEDGRYCKIAGQSLAPIIQTLAELLTRQPEHADTLKVPVIHGAQLGALADQFRWRGGAPEDVAHRLRQLADVQPKVPCEMFHGTLRPYQRLGFAWLQQLSELQLGGVLADEMGLGKTVQLLALFAELKSSGKLDRPALVVAPTSLVGNWCREAGKFTPQLTTFAWHGSKRHAEQHRLDTADVIVTTYALTREPEIYARKYSLLVVDEAQRVKNAKTQSALTLRQIDAQTKFALTGTPMENHLGELWSIFDLVSPGLLGTADEFNRFFRRPIERAGANDVLATLQARIKPFMLRREKRNVAQDLPEKTEIVTTVELGDREREVYEAIRVTMEKRVRDTIRNQGLAASHITILDALLKLRQVCCHPALVDLPSARDLQASAKLELLIELMGDMLDAGKRIIVFSQFAQMLRLIAERLETESIPYAKLTGQTRDREGAIDRFQSGQVDVFLLSLKAGGVGLNLTRADTVIHYDPWWNPAAENQATDRAHRIGQSHDVFVYKLLVKDSVEERINEMQARKSALAEGVFGELTQKDATSTAALTEADVQALLRPLSGP